ncbi:MAG: methyltransferase domain-containing protein [Xenococcaceae cyanobacterium MO_167.B52]|nr:methyltransferase domain-containing protein [Xenococcaceae cyanobacterium MO_167.B52]
MSNSVGKPVGEKLQDRPERDYICGDIQDSLLNNKQNWEKPIPVFRYENQVYKDYFAWFLQHTDEKQRIWNWFSEEFLPRLETRDVLIDAGAGNGEIMSHFLPKFHRCIAIEPSPAFTTDLLKLIPEQYLYQTTIIDAPLSLPKANLVIESHVKYYIPAEEWEINTDRLISWLTPGGCLVEVLESEHSDFQRMRAEFLGQKYVTELQQFAWQYGRRKNVEIEVDTRRAWVSCTSLEMMLGIAIFMMNDVPPDVLSNHSGRPTYKQLARWIHQNSYSPDGVYRMSCVQDFVKYFHP